MSCLMLAPLGVAAAVWAHPCSLLQHFNVTRCDPTQAREGEGGKGSTQTFWAYTKIGKSGKMVKDKPNKWSRVYFIFNPWMIYFYTSLLNLTFLQVGPLRDSVDKSTGQGGVIVMLSCNYWKSAGRTNDLIHTFFLRITSAICKEKFPI